MIIVGICGETVTKPRAEQNRAENPATPSPPTPSFWIALERVFSRDFYAGDASNFTCNVPFSNSATETEESSVPEGSVVLASDVAVGESVACQGTYLLTSADIDALATISSASVWAADKFNKEVTGSATTTTSLDQVRPAHRQYASATDYLN